MSMFLPGSFPEDPITPACFPCAGATVVASGDNAPVLHSNAIVALIKRVSVNGGLTALW